MFEDDIKAEKEYNRALKMKAVEKRSGYNPNLNNPPSRGAAPSDSDPMAAKMLHELKVRENQEAIRLREIE